MSTKTIIVVLAALAAAVLAAGCAQQGAKAEDEPHSTAVYRLGSRIPVGREGEVQQRPRTDVEEKMIQDMQRPVTPKTQSN